MTFFSLPVIVAKIRTLRSMAIVAKDFPSGLNDRLGLHVWFWEKKKERREVAQL